MSPKKKVVIFGSGKIGRLVCLFLAQTHDYEITLVDMNPDFIKQVKKLGGPEHIKYVVADFSKTTELKKYVKGKDYVLSCAPFFCNEKIALVAHELKVHYLDLTEDVKTTRFIKNLAEKSSSCFIPQCGLAPGFITIATNHLIKKFDTVHEAKMRVGALPLYPHNRLKYNLTWSTDGLINEYCNECEVVIDGKLEKVQPLEGNELFHIEGEEYEAFNTSGGLGTFAESLLGKVKRINYKSIRYPGHREILLTLLHDLKFINNRAELKKILERSLPHTFQDFVIIFVTVTGEKNGVFSQENYVKKIKHYPIYGIEWGAIQITTASGICGVLDMHARGLLPQTGFIKQESIDFEKFVKNRFGKVYC